MILILPTTFVLLFSFFNQKNSIRISLINSYLIICFQIFFITEFLSFFNYLKGNAVFFSHLFLAVLYYYFLPKLKFPKVNFLSSNIVDKALMIAIIFIAVITLFIAGISPPNNWDSMTYHLSRIQHWIQNSGVHFFDTNNFRQNLYSPFTEFIILHIEVLSNADIFANLVQWFCFIINMVVISLICKELHLNKTLQMLSSFFICSMPIVILQSSTTKNDLALSTFILLFYYYQLSGINSCSKLNIFFSGLALGLGVLTKGTAYVFLFSIGIVYLIYQILYASSLTIRTIMYKSVTIFLIGLIINLPHFLRTYFKYGNFLGLNINQIHANETFSIFTIFSNLIRYLAFQLGSTNEQLNWYLYRIVQLFLGDNISDPKTSLLGRHFRPPFFSLHEDAAGNFIHIIIMIFLFLYGIFILKKLRKVQITSFWISFISIFLYCLLFKWTAYTGKVLSLLIITTPFILVITNQLFKKQHLRKIIYLTFFLMFLGTSPYLFYNKSRPLFPLNSQSIVYQDRYVGYFKNRPELLKEYQQIINAINTNSSIKSIAYHLGGDAWDYPFWIMLKEKYGEHIPYIYHLKIEKLASLTKPNALPEYIIFENRFLENLSTIKKNYEIVEFQHSFSLMKKINKELLNGNNILN